MHHNVPKKKYMQYLPVSRYCFMFGIKQRKLKKTNCKKYETIVTKTVLRFIHFFIVYVYDNLM